MSFFCWAVKDIAPATGSSVTNIASTALTACLLWQPKIGTIEFIDSLFQLTSPLIARRASVTYETVEKEKLGIEAYARFSLQITNKAVLLGRGAITQNLW